jgi:guanylate kinase
MSGIVYIISAPSGSGKSTLVNEIRKLVPSLVFSVSYSTRPPRGSEQDGREYYFIARQEFEDMIRAGEFLEYADVFGNYYGTAKRFLREAREHGEDLILDIDVQGAAQVKQKVPEAVTIFVLPPSKDELDKRLRRRSQAEHVDSEEIIQRRLAAARKEIENYSNYDYILVNDRLEESIDVLKAIVVAERIRRSGGEASAAGAEYLALADQCRLANAGARVAAVLRSFGIDTPAAGTDAAHTEAKEARR